MSDTAAPTSRALRQLKALLDAGRPLIYICTAEEGRVDLLVQEAGARLFPQPVPVYTWSVTEGMRGPDGAVADLFHRKSLSHIQELFLFH